MRISLRNLRTAASCCFALFLCSTGISAADKTAANYWTVRREAFTAYSQKQYAACGTRFEEAARLNRWERGEDLYSSACCKALAGDTDGAFGALRLALDLGYTKADTVASDSDLAPLHTDPRWTTLVDDFKKRRASVRESVNDQLASMYDEDQKERRETPRQEWSKRWPMIEAHDRERRHKADEILRSGKKFVAEDYYNAAMLFQHGENLQDIERAEELALKAVELDPKHGAARWLVAAARDRKLMRLGKPQLYGTQFVPGNDGKVVRYRVDPTVSDEERAKWNVPPLDDSAGVPH